MANKHLFALHVPFSLPVKVGESFQIADPESWQRIVKILRLREGEQVILFNGQTHIILYLIRLAFNPKQPLIVGEVVESYSSTPLSPHITLLQGIPKKAVLEEIVYNAAQLGVTSIVPLQTTKAHALPFSAKETERLFKIMIAACEQAKQFAIPQLKNPISLKEAVEDYQAERQLVFDSTGKSCASFFSSLKIPASLTVAFGPEGGLTDEELATLEEASFEKVQLTPTILRSEDAPLLGIGLLRSLIA